MMRELVLLLVCLLATQINAANHNIEFPKDFAWGTATAAYQVEGAWNLEGRGPSIWDNFSHAGKCKDNATGDVSTDHYHRNDEDIAIMKSIGTTWYRMSISWSRVLPTGKLPVNELGVQYYLKELRALKAAGLKVMVTLYHWDLPQGLQEEYGGWINRSVVNDFKNYAELCFDRFGSLVDIWATFNEPWCTSWLGYGIGVFAPGRCSDRPRCAAGDAWTEPYLAAHHQILSHAHAVQVYREKFQKTQGGKIGIVVNCDWAEPLNASSEADIEASERQLQFFMGWFADPIFKGDYPEIMKKIVGNRLPNFTAEEKLLVNGSHDYYGLNHYTTQYITNRTVEDGTKRGWENDTHVSSQNNRNGVLIGERAEAPWLYVVPWGIRNIVRWIKNRYGDPPIYITENGVAVPNEGKLSLTEALNDTFRVNYYAGYLDNLSKAIREDKVNVKGYFAWSLLDNFEWADGYSIRFGMVYVNYTDLTRHKKASTKFFSELIKFNLGNSTGNSTGNSSTTGGAPTTTGNSSSVTGPASGGNPAYALIIIPVVLVIAVIAFILYKKSTGPERP